MSTTINVTVDDGGLPAKNRQQTAANRQAFVQGRASQQAAQQGTDQRAADRKAAGLDPATGRPLASAGASSRLPRIQQEPAANRRGGSSIEIFPPTLILPASPLSPEVEPDFQASVRRWWSVKHKGMEGPVGFGDYATNNDSLTVTYTPLYSVGDLLTIDPGAINLNVNNEGRTSTFGFGKTSLFSPRIKQLKELAFDFNLKMPPLGSRIVYGPGGESFSAVEINIALLGLAPSFFVRLTARIEGRTVSPLRLRTDNEVLDLGVQVSADELFSAGFKLTEDGASVLTVKGIDYPLQSAPLWSPTQTYYVNCVIGAGLERTALSFDDTPIQWVAKPSGAGGFGGIKVAFKQ
jgi:hypothetical protein